MRAKWDAGAGAGRPSGRAVSRRAFLAGAATGALALAGCGGTEVPEPNVPVSGTTVPDTIVPADALTAEAGAALAQLSLEQKAAQLLMAAPEAVDASGLPVGGIIYFGPDLVDARQTTAALTAAGDGWPVRPFLGVDEEGGTVSRIGGTDGFGVANVGNMADVGTATEAHNVAETIAGYLGSLGFTLDFAPVADVAVSPESPLYQRSFGSDAEQVGRLVAAAVEGFNERGLLCCAKHFPGIGGPTEDSHDAAIVSHATLEDLRACELVPFMAAIAADVPCVMVGHLALPVVTGGDTPACLSPAIVDGLLRDELGFDGVVFTDSLLMAAVGDETAPGETTVRAIEAGCDVALMPPDLTAAHQALLDAVASGRLSEERIDESVRRILRAKLRFAD